MLKILSSLIRFLDNSKLESEARQVLELIKTASQLKEVLNKLISENPKYEAELTLASNSVKANHLRWVKEQLDKREPINEIINTIAEFIKYTPKLQNKDLYFYKTLGDLRATIEALGKSNSSKKSETREALSGQFDKIYNSQKFVVFHPHSKEASCYFGQGTRWCVSAKTSRNYFNDYSGKNVFLYYIISKGVKQPEYNEEQDEEAIPTSKYSINYDFSKIAYAFRKQRGQTFTEIFDAKDTGITEADVQNYLGEEYSSIHQKMLEHVGSQENTKYIESMRKINFDEFKKQMDGIEDEEEASDYAEKVIEINKNEKDFQLAILKDQTLGFKSVLYDGQLYPESMSLLKEWISQGYRNENFGFLIEELFTGRSLTVEQTKEIWDVIPTEQKRIESTRNPNELMLNVLHNDNCHPDIITEIYNIFKNSEYKDRYVKGGVFTSISNNLNTPSNILGEMSEIYFENAKNNLPSYMPTPNVRNPNFPKDKLNDYIKLIIQNKDKISNLHEYSYFEKRKEDHNLIVGLNEIASIITADGNTDSSILKLLAENGLYLRYIFTNKNCTPEIAKIIIDQSHIRDREVMANSYASPEILTMLLESLKESPQYEYYKQLIEQTIAYGDPEI